MASEILLNRIISEILPIINSSASEDELLEKFSSSISTLFGISKVKAVSLYKGKASGSLLEYVSNTNKAYVDNQLSEYSAFPELIEYKNKGYRSCSVLPIVSNGRVTTIIEMLSEQENKFTEDLVNSVTFASYIFGFALLYKAESSMNIRLAGYFDAAFNAPFPQLLVATDGTVIKFNKPAIRHFGIVQGTNVSYLGIEMTKILQASRQHSTFRSMIKSPDGSLRLYSFYAESVSNNTTYLIASDETNSEILSAIASASSTTEYICMMLLDSSFSVSKVYGDTEKMLNYPESMIYGKQFFDLVEEKDRETFAAELKSLGEGAWIEKTMDLPLGKSGNTHVHSVFLRLPFSYFALLVSSNAEKYIKDVGAMLDDFISLSTDIIMKVNSLGYITDCNMPIESVLGYKREELLGKELKLFYNDSDVLDRDIAYVRNGRKVDGSYITLRKRNGELLPATHSMRLMKTAEAGEIEYLVVIHELQTKRQLSDQEAALREQDNEIKKLRMTSELKSQFIYNISHELKTPLTAIKGFSKLLYSGEFGALSDEQKGFVKTILDESDRLTLIIQQVLDAAKLEAKKVKLDLKEVDFKALYDSPSIKALEEAAKEKGLDFSWSVDFDVPIIIADPNRLIQVFVNLIGNSIKFTEKGGIAVRISRKSKKRVECKVSDTGIGISDEDKRKIFKKFYQAPKRELVKQDGAGTGLGLSITKDIISLHGGKISFESQQGKGTTFSFVLPIKPREKKKEKAATSPPSLST
ncbi:MAG: PAS domain-containing sensor histidine kinase [Candidatus Micrarchaeaceae archaeon]